MERVSKANNRGENKNIPTRGCTIFASPLFDNLSDRGYSIVVSSDELSH